MDAACSSRLFLRCPTVASGYLYTAFSSPVIGEWVGETYLNLLFWFTPRYKLRDSFVNAFSYIAVIWQRLSVTQFLLCPFDLTGRTPHTTKRTRCSVQAVAAL